MAGQEQQHPRRREDEQPPPEDEREPGAAGAGQARDRAKEEEVDDLLDEIDGVLEQNAEEFVHGFVQKGGQ